MPVTIPALPAAPAVANADLVVVDRSGTTYKATRSQLLVPDVGEDLVIGDVNRALKLQASGLVTLAVGSGSHIDVYNAGQVWIVCNGGDGIHVYFPVANVFDINQAGVIQLSQGQDPAGNQALMLVCQLDVGNTAPATTPGSVVAKWPVYDLTGTLIGYVPLYDAIT